MTIRVVIAHQQALLADALATFLSGAAGVEVAGVASTGADAERLIDAIRPDVVIAGSLPDADAASLASSGASVLMVATDQTPAELFRAMDAGISGFITTACSAEQMTDAVRRVARGEVVVLGVEARQMFRAVEPAPVSSVDTAELTPREREILNRICAGKSNRQIAEELFISQHTVRTHVQNIRGKLKVSSKLEAALAVVHGGRDPVTVATSAPAPAPARTVTPLLRPAVGARA